MNTDYIVNLLLIMISATFINNVILSQFLGICPFLGISNKVKSAVGMGFAVMFVITTSSIISSLLFQYILFPLGLEYLKTIVFIAVIAALVQLVEMVVKKFSPALYDALGVYLPLITTNCAVLGVALLNVDKGFDLVESIVNGFASAMGFVIAIVLIASLRERMQYNNIPRTFKGFPITLVTATLMAMAFYGFAGLV